MVLGNCNGDNLEVSALYCGAHSGECYIFESHQLSRLAYLLIRDKIAVVALGFKLNSGRDHPFGESSVSNEVGSKFLLELAERVTTLDECSLAILKAQCQHAGHSKCFLCQSMRELSYYDGPRGKIDRVSATRDEFSQSHNRPKRTHSANVQGNFDSQGVSCPSRLRENSLNYLRDPDRTKEVHFPCPRRKSSGAEVVPSFKGKSMENNAAISYNWNRARELLKKNTGAYDLNHAVKQHAQWHILSSRGWIQKPSQGYISQNVCSSTGTDQAGKNLIMNYPFVNSNQGVTTLDRAVYRNGANTESRKPQYGQLSQVDLQNTGSQLKPKFQAQQSNINAPPTSRLTETGPLEKERQLSAAPVQGYFNVGPVQQPYRNLPVQHPQVIQDPFPQKDGRFLTPYDTSQPLSNSYNLTHYGPHHYSPNNPSGQLTYQSASAVLQMSPAFFQSHVTPGKGIQQFAYTLYTFSMPSENPKIFDNANETRNGPWAPGSLKVDVPPGYAHQPKLPKTTTRSLDTVNIQDLPKGSQKIPVSNNQPSYQKGDQQYHPFPIKTAQQESWRYQYHQDPKARQEAPVRSYEKLGVTSFLVKTTLAYKGVFGKLKKDGSKVKSMKPPKISVSNPQANMPPGVAQGGPHRYSPLQQQQEVLSKQHNHVNRHEVQHFDTKAKTSQDRILSPKCEGRQEYWNFSGDMPHILDSPAAFYANKAHKIASKFASSEDVTYVPFRGVPSARNGEAFYDKNLHFLEKVDRPPMVNTKKRKWCKLNRCFNVDRVHKLLHADSPVGSESVEFHSGSDMTVQDLGSDYELKTAGCHYRKCQYNRGHT